MMWFLDADGRYSCFNFIHGGTIGRSYFIFFLIEYKHFGTAVSSLPSESFIAGMSSTWALTTKGKVFAGWYVITFGVDPVDPSGATNTTQDLAEMLVVVIPNTSRLRV